MKRIPRPLPAIALLATLALAACGGSTPTSTVGPGTLAPGATSPSGAGPGPTTGPGTDVEGIGAELLAQVFGTSIPTPDCADLNGGGKTCRWLAGDGELMVDAGVQTDLETETEWREAFGDAGVKEEIPGMGVPVLGGDNPLADGWRATAYTSDGLAYTVTINKPGDQAAVKAIVLAILAALAA